MPEKHSIRWRNRDRDELKRVVKNYNAKVTRLKKKNPYIADLYPDKIKVSDVTKSIETRTDYNREIARLQRFSKRGAEEIKVSDEGATATKWEVQNFYYDQRRENNRRKKERERLEKMPVTSRGKDTGQTRATMGKIKENAVKPLNKKFDKLSQKEWEKAKAYIDSRLDEKFMNEQKGNMKDNYIKGLKNAGFSKELVDLMEQLDSSKFVDVVDIDTEADFDFIYDPQELAYKNQVLLELWGSVMDGTYSEPKHPKMKKEKTKKVKKSKKKG